MKIWLVEDEPVAAARLAAMLSKPHLPALDLKVFNSPLACLKQLEKEAPVALILDISMPEMSGLDLAKKARVLLPDIEIIFATAHESHSLEAFELNAVHYLLKPYRQQKVDEAVERILKRQGEASKVLSQAFWLVPTEEGQRKILEMDVVGVIAHDKLSEVFLSDNSSVMVRHPLKWFEDHLTPDDFIKTHRSAWVALRFIQKVKLSPSGSKVLEAEGIDKVFPLSRRLTSEVISRLEKG